jgi:hypothetical protein
MKIDEKLIKSISKDLHIDERVVGLVSHYPFQFISRAISEPSNRKPIMLKYLGKFVLRYTTIEKK